MVREFFIFQCLLGFFYQVKAGSREPVAQIRYVGKGLPQTVRSEVELGLVMRAEEPENAVFYLISMPGTQIFEFFRSHA